MQLLYQQSRSAIPVEHNVAFISGDRDMMRFFTEKDPQFGLVMVGTSKKAVRIKYSDDCGIPEGNRDPKYILALASDGEIKATFKEQDLLRDADGKIIHTKYDLHWSLAEWVQEAPRESLSEKKDRGSGKVGNFCLARGSRVATEKRGRVCIEDVTVEDRVWDGQAWVSHAGVVYKGKAETVQYDGLQATDNHTVWVSDTAYMDFGRARDYGIPLQRGNAPGEYWDVYSEEVHEPLGVVDVYDLLNAGPQHRFTCEGVLVSNSSAYGATGSTLERKIRADVGSAPTPGTGDKILEALAGRQPAAVAWLESLESVPEHPGYMVAKSGAIRHFKTHPEYYNVGFKARKSILSGLGRQARNYL